MKQLKMRNVFLLASLSVLFAGCASESKKTQEQLAVYQQAEKRAEANLVNFDDLDFNVFSNQRWDQLSRSHAPDIVVHWPDGRMTKGIEAHITDLKGMFVYAPDTRIKVHPIRIGTSDWTAVEGVMEGTFTKPMPLGNGKTAPPTGKSFKLSMATIGHWQNGVMIEEWLFWDNMTFMKQIGLAK